MDGVESNSVLVMKYDSILAEETTTRYNDLKPQSFDYTLKTNL